MAIPTDWNSVSINQRDTDILVTVLRQAGHTVNTIQKGWAVGKGINSRGTLHSVFLADDGNHYGVKCATGTDEGSSKEYTLWRIACQLGLSGAYTPALMHDVGVMEYPKDYRGSDYHGPAVVTRWVNGSEPIGELLALFDSNESISRQVGEWWSFCALTGLGDRHYGNFVYSKAENVFAAIDMEFAFYTDDSTYLLTSLIEATRSNRLHVKQGAEACTARIDANLASIKRIIKEGKIATVDTTIDDSTPTKIRSSLQQSASY